MRMRHWIGLSLAGMLLAAAAPVAWRASHPAPTRAFDATRLADVQPGEVRFHNGAQGLPLAGMLFRPDGPPGTPRPAVVVIQGSGTSVRDNGWYLTLAEHLRREGIIVLLPDKRGSEQSGGDWHNASMQDLATDTQAAIDWLRGQEELAVGPVGVVGMSQGGWIAPIVASRPGNVDFVVTLSGSTLPAFDTLRFEENNNLREMGLLPGLSDIATAVSTQVLRHFTQPTFWNAVGNYDPLPYWRQVEAPSLLLFGAGDPNTPAIASVERLRTLERANLHARLYPGSTHAIESPPGEGDALIRPDALSDIVAFIRAIDAGA